MKVYDLEEYRNQKRLRALLEKLDNMADEAAENYDETERKGYENFKRLLVLMDKKYYGEKEDE
jgi:hypothetical protein